jgi:glycerol uptake operon antiterminator
MSLLNIEMLKHHTYPDVIEILPGIIPKVTKKICSLSPVPVIAGGLITDKEDVMAALAENVISISTTNQNLWFS